MRKSVKIHLARLALLLVFIWVQIQGRLAMAAEPCAASFVGQTLYVAPGGNDAWPGKSATRTRRDGPLATLQGARNRIRQLRGSKPAAVAFRVLIADGSYPLAEPVVFGPQDGGTEQYPVCYQAASGARPVFSGGRKITGWQAGADGVWWTDVPAVKEGSWYFEQLWVNGRRARRARAGDDTVTYTFGVQETQLGTNQYQQAITVHAPDLQRLAGLTPAELADVSFVALHKWNMTRRFLSAADVAGGVLTVQSSAPMADYNAITAWTPYYLDNFRAALDQPGEWFLARDGRLYYKPRPGEDMLSAAVVAPYAWQLLTIAGTPASGAYVSNIAFDGLSFAHSQSLTPPRGVDPVASSTADAAIIVGGARNVVFRNCEIAHTGTYAIWFLNGTADTALRRCKLEDLGAGGVRIGDTYSARETSASFTRRVTLDNNIIRHGGRLFHNAYGVWIGRASDNHVTHNDIADFFQHGISVGWVWGYGASLTVRNNISFNHIHRLGWRLLSDIGGVHTLGVSPGTVVNNNVIHDIAPLAYGGWGLYLDEGSSYISASNNLVYNNLSGLHLHYGYENAISNNIFAANGYRELLKTLDQPWRSLVFTRNVVYRTGPELMGGFEAPDVTLESNLYFGANGQPLSFAGMDFAAWQGTGRDAGSMMADPLFTDPAKADYSLRPDSPAAAVGFVPFDATQAGVHGDAAWRDEAMLEPYAETPWLGWPSFAHLP